jgi:hypothetical protein
VTRSTGEQDGQNCVERSFRVAERIDENRLHAIIDFVDDLNQVESCLLEVGQLFGEEMVALFERREFFECEWVHPAELIHRLLGGLQARFLFDSHKRNRIALQHRNEGVGAVFLDEDLFGERHVVSGLFEEVAEVKLLFVDLHLETVDSVSDGAETCSQVGLAGTQIGELAGTCGARAFRIS